MELLSKEIKKIFYYWWNKVIQKAFASSMGFWGMKALVVTLLISIALMLFSGFLFFFNLSNTSWVNITIEQVKYNFAFTMFSLCLSSFIFLILLLYIPSKIYYQQEHKIEELKIKNEESNKLITSEITLNKNHICSSCGYGYPLNNDFTGKDPSILKAAGVTLVCPKCKNREPFPLFGV